jgi:hypothetical protein
MPKKCMAGQQGMMGDGKQMPMMPMCMSMMKGMAGHDMMMQGMLQGMRDVTVIQEKILKGVKPAEKAALMEDLLRLQGKIDLMLSNMKQMSHRMPGPTPEVAPAKDTPAPAPHHQ